MKIIVVGGDQRYLYLTKMLKERGHEVEHFFADKLINWQTSTVLKECEGVILPVPVSKDDKNINTPLWHEEIAMKDFFNEIPGGAIVVGGVVTSSVADVAKNAKLSIQDIMLWEELTIRNAIATAEGALYLAIKETDRTIFDMNCLVVGYGRIGRILSKCLKGLGAKVTLATRRADHVSWIKAEGYDSIPLGELERYIGTYDFVFNTAPAKVFVHSVLRKMKHDTIIMDLASMPGGVDFDQAKKLGIKTIHALGLPGKTAPRSAAEYIADTVENFFIDEINVLTDQL